MDSWSLRTLSISSRRRWANLTASVAASRIDRGFQAGVHEEGEVFLAVPDHMGASAVNEEPGQAHELVRPTADHYRHVRQRRLNLAKQAKAVLLASGKRP
jgi:hypothetical protein